MSTELIGLTLLVLAGCGVACGLVAHVMLIQPPLEAPRNGMRGLKRARARRTGSGFAQLEPLMAWLGARILPLISPSKTQKLAREITIAGEVWGMWPAEMQALSLIGFASGGVISSVLVQAFDWIWLYVPLCSMLGFMLPGMQLSSLAKKRLRGIQRRIPHVVDMLVLSLGAGLDFSGALRHVVDRAADPSSDTIEELGVVLEELKLGHTRGRVLAGLAERAPCDEVRDLVAATVQSEEQGTPLGVVLQTQASTSRQRRSTRAEETASKASTAMVLPLVLVFVALIILIIGPTVFDAMQSSDKLGG